MRLVLTHPVDRHPLQIHSPDLGLREASVELTPEVEAAFRDMFTDGARAFANLSGAESMPLLRDTTREINVRSKATADSPDNVRAIKPKAVADGAAASAVAAMRRLAELRPEGIWAIRP